MWRPRQLRSSGLEGMYRLLTYWNWFWRFLFSFFFFSFSFLFFSSTSEFYLLLFINGGYRMRSPTWRQVRNGSPTSARMQLLPRYTLLHFPFFSVCNIPSCNLISKTVINNITIKEAIPFFHETVRKNFRGLLKAPFNTPARLAAGMTEDWYLPLTLPLPLPSIPIVQQ